MGASIIPGRQRVDRPSVINDSRFRFDSFENGEVFPGKASQKLPAMGWNSWNAFGSGNTEELTKAMAERIVSLGLDKLGYRYVVLDDGCYKQERTEGLLSNDENKFPSGFRSLADHIHSMGLKFGMYNDIGTNLCAGAAVGTCGHERVDARTYLEWGVDFIKVDNCYYPWDNATFSDSKNAGYTFAPNIKAIKITGKNTDITISALNARIIGEGASVKSDYVTGIGTFDGTGPEHSPVGLRSCELHFEVYAGDDGDYEISLLYATGAEEGMGKWLQMATADQGVFFDDPMPETDDSDDFVWSDPIKFFLHGGKNVVRIMNHRRQENTLCSYAALLEGFYEADPKCDVLLSICEWGKTQPQNWGYKVGNSWRILNDITFQVGSDGDPGHGAWESDYTTGVAVQYNKAVIMDEFAGLDRGWNDPDMLMIGMDGLNIQMCATHFAMWCMMSAPLMLGLDLRNVKKGDDIYNIIANEEIIALDQDPLGIQAKRVFTTYKTQNPDKEYIRDNNRVDVLAKPLSGGDIAVSFINLGSTVWNHEVSVEFDDIARMLKGKMPAEFAEHESFRIKDLWSKNKSTINEKRLSVCDIPAYGNKTFRVSAG